MHTSTVETISGTSGQSVALPEGKLVLYAAVWCGYCRKAKAYLGSKQISYKEIDIDTDFGKNAFAQMSNGQGIPLLFAQKQRIQGYSEDAYKTTFL